MHQTRLTRARAHRLVRAPELTQGRAQHKVWRSAHHGLLAHQRVRLPTTPQAHAWACVGISAVVSMFRVHVHEGTPFRNSRAIHSNARLVAMEPPAHLRDCMESATVYSYDGATRAALPARRCRTPAGGTAESFTRCTLASSWPRVQHWRS